MVVTLHTITVMLVDLVQPPEQCVHVPALHTSQSVTPGSSDVWTVIGDPPHHESLGGDHVLTRVHLKAGIPAPDCAHLAPVENIHVTGHIIVSDVHVHCTGHLQNIILVDK